MSKVIASLEKVLLPFAVKIGKQPHVNAIKNGFIKLMPLTLAGAMFVLINNVFLSFGEGSYFYSLGIRLDASTIENYLAQQQNIGITELSKHLTDDDIIALEKNLSLNESNPDAVEDYLSESENLDYYINE